MNLKHKLAKEIVISNHALERGKQRLVIKGAEPNSLLYEMRLKEIIQDAQFRTCEADSWVYELVYDNAKYKIVATAAPNNCVLIKTIVGKD